MYILAFETSTDTTSVVLYSREKKPVARSASGHSHCEELLGLVQAALADADASLSDVDSIAVGHGPGSFTGLRIGLATAKGICFAGNLPLYSVSSLAAQAQTVAVASGETLPADTVIVALADARRDELFAGYFKMGTNGVVFALRAEEVITPIALVEVCASFKSPVLLTGEGAIAYEGYLSTFKIAEQNVPSAIAVAQLAIEMDTPSDLETAAPLYARATAAEVTFPQGNLGGTFAPASSSTS